MRVEAPPKVLKAAWVLLLVAVIFRGWLAPDARFTGDESYFWATARNTATLDARPIYGPSMTDSPAHHPGPLFYYLMAVPQRFGSSPLWGSYAVILLHALAGWLLFCLAFRARGSRAGLIALALFAFAPWDVLYGDRIWLSCVAPVWGSLILYSAVRARDSGAWQGALLFFACTCPQLHMSAPIVWVAAALLLFLNPPKAWSLKSLSVGALLTVLAYGLPLYHELTHEFQNTKAILEHAGGTIDSDVVAQHPVRVMLYALFYGTSEIGYHFGRGYWMKFDALQTYLSLDGWRGLFQSQGLLWGSFNLVSICVAAIAWAIVLYDVLRSSIRGLLSRSRVHLNPSDRFVLALVFALASATALLMFAEKGFFPHYANLLMPMMLFPVAVGVDRLLGSAKKSWIRAPVWLGLVLSVVAMFSSTVRYYDNVDQLNGLATTRAIVSKIMAEPAAVAVQFEGFQNLFAWTMLAQTEYKRSLNVTPSGRIHYRIKNNSVHRGKVPPGAELIGGVLIIRSEL